MVKRIVQTTRSFFPPPENNRLIVFNAIINSNEYIYKNTNSDTVPVQALPDALYLLRGERGCLVSDRV